MRGLKTDLADALVEGQPTIRVEQRVAGQRPRIVTAALDIVVRIAARAVVARAGGAHDGQPFLDKSSGDEMGGEHIFETSPHFL